MEQYGNTSTYNMESVLRKNIVDSEYYRDTCMKLTTWGQVVDEIYYSVSDVEPWMSGNARGASTAFCLPAQVGACSNATKLSHAQARAGSVLTSSMPRAGSSPWCPPRQEVKDLLDHVDSAYIRAVNLQLIHSSQKAMTAWMSSLGPSRAVSSLTFKCTRR